MQKRRDVFIDSIKIYACILVVLGHFFQSMVSSGVVENHSFLEWFDITIYYFHVPLFFICSGYLFSKYSVIERVSDYKDHILKKMLALGVPYFFFSIVTWGLKVLFSSQVNNEADGLFTTLFVDPVSPYWYLYTLFFVFIITPAVKSKKSMLAIIVAGLCLKFASFYIAKDSVFVLVSVTTNEIWFVFGMMINVYDLERLFKKQSLVYVGVGLSALFIVGSVMLYLHQVRNDAISFLMGIVACVATLIFAVHTQGFVCVNKCVTVFSKYTMPVFLMHTIFAATLRAVLIKLSVTSVMIHVVFGIVISFLGPILAYKILSEFKFTDFIFNPTKYIRIAKQEKKNG